MDESREPSAKDVPETAAGDVEVAHLGKVWDAKRQWRRDLEAAFPGQVVREGKKWRLSIDRRSDPQAFKKLREVTQAARRLDIEKSGRLSAGPRVVLRDREGRSDVFKPEVAERVARKRGLHEAPRYARRRRDFSVGHVLLRNGMLQRYLGENRWEVIE